MITPMMGTEGAAWEPAQEGWERRAVVGSQARGEGEDCSGSLPKNRPFSALMLGGADVWSWAWGLALPQESIPRLPSLRDKSPHPMPCDCMLRPGLSLPGTAPQGARVWPRSLQ